MNDPAVKEDSAGQPKQQFAGFWSSDRNFGLRCGQAISDDGIRGYYIDFRIKAPSPDWPPPWLEPFDERLHIAPIQWALGCHERWIAGEGDRWLSGALLAAEDLIAGQCRDGGDQDGGWVHNSPYPHTFLLRPPWVSGISQGEGASLMVRLHAATGDDRFAEAARRALRPLRVASERGGVRASLDARPFPEEYPTTPPSYVLNGAIFGLWGIHDVAVGLADVEAQQELAVGLEMLEASLHRWDLGWWSRYDLHPHPIPNPASSAYHALHISQLQALSQIAPRSEFERVLRRFESYSNSRAARTRALAHKVAFRLAVPRNPSLSRLVAWGRTAVRR